MSIQGFPGKTRVIKSIQRGQTAVPTADAFTDVTITSVDTDKAVVSMSSSAYVAKQGGTSDDDAVISAYLTSSTNLRIYNDGTNAFTFTDANIAWEVIEYV